MGAPAGPSNPIINFGAGKPNKKKMCKIYNKAFGVISNLWLLLPDSAKIALRSDECNVDDLKAEDCSTSGSKTENLKERVNKLKGKVASFKEKMAKKKLSNKLKKKKKAEKMQQLKEELRKRRKEFKQKHRTEKRLDEVAQNVEITSASDNNMDDQTISNDSKTTEIIKTKRKKNKLEEMLISGDSETQNDNSSGLSKKKQKLLLKKKLMAQKKKEKKKLSKAKKQETLAITQTAVKVEERPRPVKSDDDEVLYNKIDVEDEEATKIFRKEKPRAEKDPVKALNKIEELHKKINHLKVSGQAEKAEAIRNRESWKKAILKADGVKVKDDVKLLKKTIRRKEKKKSKSKEDWEKRKEIQNKKISDAQKKRKENIRKKKKEKNEKKIKKSIKKGRVVI